jgi:SufS family cysteine desulfurase
MTTANIRADFPILATEVRGKPLVYLDNAATTQKPQSVIDAIRHYYEAQNSNVHRAAHYLADLATTAVETSRDKLAAFINAPAREEVIFTGGTTESINLVASCLDAYLQAGDQILISHAEHHANIVPWQMLATRTGANLVACNLLDSGDLDLDDFKQKLHRGTKLVALGHVSNALGTLNPVDEIVQLAKAHGALVLIDGAQAVGHLSVDVQSLGCDFYAFSGHKMFGPTGIGVLWGRSSLLEEMPPWQGGGEMIRTVSIASSTYNELPYKYEAGTPNMAGIVGLGAAVDYLNALPRKQLQAEEDRLLAWTISQLQQVPGIKLVGEPKHRVGAISFVHDEGHPHDLGTLLDQQGIAVRTGHHCAMPLMDHLKLPGTVRASFCLYNQQDDAQRFIDALHKAVTFL